MGDWGGGGRAPGGGPPAVRSAQGEGPASAVALSPVVAGMGVRLGAWLLDWVIFMLMGAALGAVATASGVVGENPEAARHLLADPGALPNVPLLTVHLDGLTATAVVWVVLVTVYPALAWARFRCLPGQRLASLQVADQASGANLRLPRALARSFVLNAPLAAALATSTVAVVDIIATYPASDLMANNSDTYGLINSGRWAELTSLASLVVWIWPPMLLVSTWMGFRRRGLHDSAGGSVVVRLVRVPGPWRMGQVTAGPPAGRAGDDQPPGRSLPPAQAPAPQWPPPPAADGTPGGPSESLRAAGSGWVASAESEPVPGRLAGVHRVAPLNRRVVAYLLDGVLIYAAYGFAMFAVRGAAAGAADVPIPDRDVVIVGLAAGAAQCAYFVATWWMLRGSLGQRVTGLLVVRETGERLGPLDGMARWAVLQGPLALVIAMPVGYVLGSIAVAVWAAVLLSSVRQDPLGRGYHDRVAGSRVIFQE
jgi:hypothetical protein